MHKLGNNNITPNDRCAEIETSVKAKRNFQINNSKEIKTILAARRNLYNAGVALLECDNGYAENIKCALERYYFSSHTIPFAGAGAVKIQINETDILNFLQSRLRIYVKLENIIIDWENSICRIRLNDKTTANIQIKNGAAFESIVLSKDQTDKTLFFPKANE